jgi:hypothetical protein
MPHDPKAVDALLGASCSRMLNAAYKINQMRELYGQGKQIEYWRLARDLAEDLTVGGHCLTEAHRLQIADMPVFAQPEGGLLN